jgi:hypothetical protein
MDKDTALRIISETYNIDIEILLNFILTNSKESNDLKKETSTEIILPFCGIIHEDRCKGVIFNHGLYTQCRKKSKKEYCSSCSNLKYGNIFERSKYKIGEFKTNDGKSEIIYSKFVKKMNYDVYKVIDELKKYNLSIPELEELKKSPIYYNSEHLQKRGRGRPKKLETQTKENQENEEDLIEVVEVIIDSKKYYKTKENVLLDIDTHRIIGHFNNNKIENLHI